MKFLKIFGLALASLVCLNFSNIEKPVKVVIDAGHGGKDSGVIVNGISEKDLVHSISQKIEALEDENIEIILLRNDDSFISLKDRVKRINTISPDLVISLHLDNTKSETSTGTKAFIYKNDRIRTSHYYAAKLLKSFNSDNKNVKFAGFYILKHSNSPAVNLYLGNFNNREDLSFLTTDLGQDYIANQIISCLK